MSPESLDLQSIVEAAKAGGAILNGYFGQTLETTQKSTAADFRTKADLESEEAILASLAIHFPDYNIFSEETGAVHRGSEFTFVIDPLDGTNNFVLGIPLFAVSIGLFQNDTVIAGVIHLPYLHQTYYAQKGAGAFLEGKRLQVSTVEELCKATIAHNCNYLTPPEKIGQSHNRIISLGTKRLLTSWCPTSDYCLLASGKIEGLINYGTEVHDFSAGKLIAEEAGAKVTDLQNQPLDNDTRTEFLVSNRTKIHDILIEIARL